MKKLLFVMILSIICATMARHAYADGIPANTPEKSEQRKERTKERAKKEKAAVEKAPQVATPAVRNATEERRSKTIVEEIAKAIKETSPQKWEALVSHQRTNALVQMLIPLLLVLLLAFITLKTHMIVNSTKRAAEWHKVFPIIGLRGQIEKVAVVDRKYKAMFANSQGSITPYGYAMVAHVVAIVLLSGALFWFGIKVGELLQILIDPDFYAMKELVRMLVTGNTID